MPGSRVRPENLEAEVLEALAHPLRIRILRSLLQTGCCQCELATRLHEHPVSISRHLAILVRTGLVSVRKEGTKTYPEIAKTEVREILRLAEGIVLKTASARAREAQSFQDATSLRHKRERRIP